MALGFEYKSMKFGKAPPSAISKTIRLSGAERCPKKRSSWVANRTLSVG
jgi:hypothetical protein